MKHFKMDTSVLFTVTDVELKRLKDAFKRTSGLSAYMTQQCFFKEVLGDGVPPKVAEVLRAPTHNNSSLSLSFFVLTTSTTKSVPTSQPTCSLFSPGASLPLFWVAIAVNVLSITTCLPESSRPLAKYSTHEFCIMVLFCLLHPSMVYPSSATECTFQFVFYFTRVVKKKLTPYLLTWKAGILMPCSPWCSFLLVSSNQVLYLTVKRAMMFTMSVLDLSWIHGSDGKSKSKQFCFLSSSISAPKLPRTAICKLMMFLIRTTASTWFCVTKGSHISNAQLSNCIP